MAEDRIPGGRIVNPTLIDGAFVLPPAHADAEVEARLIRQLAAIDRAAAGPRARLSRVIAFVWRWYANLCGAALISGSLSALAIWCFAGNGDIVVGLSPPQPEIAAACPDKGIACVRPGGQLAFKQDIRRYEACPGEVVELFSRPPRVKQVDGQSVELVQQRRPAVNVSVNVFPDARLVTQVPATLSPGRWGFSWSVDNHCPDREKIDEVAAFEIEVLP